MVCGRGFSWRRGGSRRSALSENARAGDRTGARPRIILARVSTWIIERELNQAAERVAVAARDAGHRLLRWSPGEPIVCAEGESCIFLGSLTACPSVPGVIGDPERLRVSAWLPRVEALVLNREVLHTTVGDVASLELPWSRVFVRPDSAMKPFAGRVLEREQIDPGALDHGFYYENLDLPIVLSPAQEVVEEWRFVAVERQLVAESGYQADGRTGEVRAVPEGARAVAVAAAARSPEPSVVIDVCRTDGGDFSLVEYNLLSGSDLYACDATAIVAALG